MKKTQMTQQRFIITIALLVACAMGIVAGMGMLDSGKQIGAITISLCIMGTIINCFNLFQKVYPYLPEKEQENEENNSKIDS